ncbi:MAG TPA: GNAT family N-acetyltransferase [Solirubrobacteraceae bacterium]|jgi:ribosomal protein S18 acetylase RimI-like enzyme|nr:GNAT family N-acetyltransferase [Solirubrobacteraceae bacterium]
MAQTIRSLVWATDIDVLERDHVLDRRDGYWAVRSPDNPKFWWGNFLLFDDPPAAGDGERWEALFRAEFGARADVTHRSFAWDRVDGEAGDAERELVARGYELEWTSGLVAKPDQIVLHPRANEEVVVQALDADGDQRLWDGVIELQQAQAPDGYERSDYHRTFLKRRQDGLRELFHQDRGAWYVALLDDVPVASLGIVVTGARARFQAVDTLETHRRKGIATRLVAEAAAHAASEHSIDHFVIAADPDYHAIGIYEGLGFGRAELVVGALLKPQR